MQNHFFVSSKYFKLLIVCSLVFVLCQSFAFSQWLPTITDERGDTVHYSFPPADSTYIHNQIIIYFRASALRLDSLCYYLPAPIIGKNTKDEPLGIPTYTWSYLMRQQFPIQNILRNSNLKIALQNLGATYLKRISVANPCTDTVSITRYGDRIKCDDYLWMTLNFNNDTVAATAVIQLLFFYQTDIQWADLNYFLKPCTDSVPRDFHYSKQISLQPQMCGFEHAWMRQAGDTNIRIAVVDDGLDYHNCDLGSTYGFGKKVAGGWNFSEPGVYDFSYLSSHGTNVAGIIGAYTNKDSCATSPQGIAGTAGGYMTYYNNSQSRGIGCTLYGYRTVSPNPPQPGVNLEITSEVVGAIRQAASHGDYGYGDSCHIINMSFGSSVYSESMRAALNYAFMNGVSCVASRGNNGDTNIVYPACYDNDWLTSVGASFKKKERASDYSSWGGKMDLLAPGGTVDDNKPAEEIVFTTAYTNGGTNLNKCEYFSGTSASAPHVAGLIALLRSTARDSNWTNYEPEDYEGMVKASALDIDTSFIKYLPPRMIPKDNYQPGYDIYSGWGHLQADKMYDMLDDDYRIYHDSTSNNLDSGAWSGLQYTYFFRLDTNKIDWVDSNLYMAKSRPITSHITLQSGKWLIDSTHKLYVWGRSGRGSKSGYSLSNVNYHTGYTRILSGSGGNATVDGIYHSDSLNVSVVTYQYDLWDKTGTKHLGYVPPTDMLGFNITAFGCENVPTGVKSEEFAFDKYDVFIYPIPTKNQINFQIQLKTPTYLSFNLYDCLGNKIKEFDNSGYYSGVQTLIFDVKDISTGVYFLRMNSDNDSKTFKIILESK